MKVAQLTSLFMSEKRYLLIYIGLFIIIGIIAFEAIMRPDSSYRTKIISSILKAKPDEVLSIIISPEGTKLTEFDLVKSAKTITDKHFISQICHALRQAEPWDPNHPIAIWNCVLTINRKDDSLTFIVTNAKNNNGILIFIYSEGTSGWLLGSYRSDALGPILEGMVNST